MISLKIKYSKIVNSQFAYMVIKHLRSSIFRIRREGMHLHIANAYLELFS